MPRQMPSRPSSPAATIRGQEEPISLATLRRDHPKSLHRFIHRLNTLSAAAVGAYAIKGTELDRAQKGLRQLAHLKEKPFYIWDVIKGWTLVGSTPEKTKNWNARELMNPVNALAWITAPDEKNEPRTGFFVMVWPHFYSGTGNSQRAVPEMLAWIRNHSEAFTRNPFRRLFLMMPDGANIADEIEHDLQDLTLDLPSADELSVIIEQLSVQKVPDGNGGKRDMRLNFTELEVEQAINICLGMTHSQAACAFSQALAENHSLFPDIPAERVMETLQMVKVEVVRKCPALSLVKPRKSMADVGGMAALKRWLSSRLISLTAEGRAAGADPVKGYAAFGPPGTGKSLIAEVTATVLGIPVVRLDVGALFGSLVGQSEANMRRAVKILKGIGRVVVWIDEVDKAGMSSGGHDGGVNERVFGQLLTLMQESDSLFWVVTGNWPEKVDPAFLRKGRMDEVFAILPPNPYERREILEIHMRNRRIDPATVDLSEVITATDGLVAAELEHLVKEAKLDSLNEGIPVTGELLMKQLGQTKKLADAFPEKMAYMIDWANKNARKASDEMPTHATHRPKAIPPQEGRHLEIG